MGGVKVFDCEIHGQHEVDIKIIEFFILENSATSKPHSTIFPKIKYILYYYIKTVTEIC